MSSFFFNAPPTTEIYTLSLHDALPILLLSAWCKKARFVTARPSPLFCGWQTRNPLGSRIDSGFRGGFWLDRKSTRLNSSHANISYAVFCLKKKKKKLARFNCHHLIRNE